MFWDESETYRLVPSYSYEIPCSCSATTSVKHYRNQDYVICFLKGLNESLSSSKSQIVMMQLLPHIDHAFSLVIQQECEMLSPSFEDIFALDTTIPATALQVNSNSSNGGNKSWNPNFKGKTVYAKPNRVCTHCGRTNHTTETCFVKHGCPPRFKNKPKLNSPANNVSHLQQAQVLDSRRSSTTTSWTCFNSHEPNILL